MHKERCTRIFLPLLLNVEYAIKYPMATRILPTLYKPSKTAILNSGYHYSAGNVKSS